jgi:sugar/nucleoside kinase (ribokinase family)
MVLLTAPEQVRLVSIVGNDPAGAQLLSSWARTGSSCESIQVSDGVHTAAVCLTLEETGEMATCVADTCIIECPAMLQWAQAKLPRLLQHAKVAVLDANLEERVLAYAASQCRHFSVLAAFEPVSAAKAARCSTAHRICSARGSSWSSQTVGSGDLSMPDSLVG